MAETKRVNITIPTDLHQQSKRIAKRRYGSFSQLVRSLIHEEISGSKEGQDQYSGQIAAKLKDIEEKMDKMEEKLEKVEQNGRELRSAISEDPDDMHNKKKIVNYLHKQDEPVTISDISESLSIPIGECKKSIEKLDDEFLLNRHESGQIEIK